MLRLRSATAHPTIESFAVIARCPISITCAPVPLLPTWEKGLGDEGYFIEVNEINGGYFGSAQQPNH
jgi:hypothetical protein